MCFIHTRSHLCPFHPRNLEAANNEIHRLPQVNSVKGMLFRVGLEWLVLEYNEMSNTMQMNVLGSESMLSFEQVYETRWFS